MSRNALWQIAFGDYDFALDRRSLTYSLTETKTGTVWADGLSVGWLELEDRETGERIRHSFAEMKLVSLSEKSGQQGKRILLGLDCQGVPVDLYFICSQKEIQLTVEASRDTRTHRVQGICLLPGLVAVPDDGISYLVIPEGEGAILYATDTPTQEEIIPIWARATSTSMPFIGAVRNKTFNEPVSALALITDSVYGAYHLERQSDGSAKLETHYTRDPERRRLDLRLVVLPQQNYVGIARAYRNKIIIDRNHITLRQKMREKPGIEKLLGSAFFIDHLPPKEYSEATVTVRYRTEIEADAVCLLELDPGLSASKAEDNSLWEGMDTQLGLLQEKSQTGVAVGSPYLSDWCAIACDFWQILDFRRSVYRALIPLYSVVYHDSVIAISPNPLTQNFLRSMLRLSLPSVSYSSDSTNTEDGTQELKRKMDVLGPLHRLSFAAFLSEHRFLTPNLTVEEARYTNGAYILINQSDTEIYETERLTLPPLGFYVDHPQMIAHDALRVGDEQWEKRAYRIARSQDGKPLTESTDIQRQEFPV
jgi:hypothetical protein